MGNNNLEALESLLIDILKCSKEDLKDDNGPDNLINWDSITHMEMVSRIEEKFNINFDIDEINSIDSIGALKSALRNQKILLNNE